MLTETQLSELPSLSIDMKSAKAAYARLVTARTKPLIGGAEPLSFDEAISQSDEAGLVATKRYLRRLDLQEDGKAQHAGHCFINGKHAPINEVIELFSSSSRN